jgi:DNA-binding NarL/FixJ family response regulator
VTAIVALVPDLMDRSRVSAASSAVTFLDLTELRGVDPDLVIVDLGRVDARELRAAAPSSRIIGFGSHVDDTLLAEASRAGIDEVMPRSVFFRRLPQLLR